MMFTSLSKPTWHRSQCCHAKDLYISSQPRSASFNTNGKHRRGARLVSAASSRRFVLLGEVGWTAAFLIGGTGGLMQPQQAKAALVQFPANSLHNTYYLARAGENENAANGDTVFTNPVWKTSMRCGLSANGKQQVYNETLRALKEYGVCQENGCWFWPSITQNAYQTAEILAYATGMGRSRIVPEYSFLDARGLGALEDLPMADALPQVRHGDFQDPAWRPLPGTDGTPNESVQDVLVRMRQVISITETQYSGADIVFIAPDSDTLSVLQAGVLGVDLRRHADFSFRPGEVKPLLLSDRTWDASPRQVPCGNPPSCTQAERTLDSPPEAKAPKFRNRSFACWLDPDSC